MQDRSALFGVATGWACLWASLGILRAAGFDLGWVGHDPWNAESGAPLVQVPATVSRLLGLLQLVVAAAFLRSLLPMKTVPAEDRMLGACAWAMIVLGIVTLTDCMTLSATELVLDGLLFVGLACTALMAATADHRATRGAGGILFGWARRDARPGGQPLADAGTLDEYRAPCRTSSQT